MTGNFVAVALPRGVSIELPRNWVVLSDNQRITLDSSAEARSTVPWLSELPFAANCYDDDRNTIGIVNVRYYPQLEVTQADARALAKHDLEELDTELKTNLSAEVTISSWGGTVSRDINGITALVTEYSRPSLKGSGEFRVRLVRVFAGEESFTLTVSYLDSVSVLLRPVTDRIISSLARRP